MADSFYLRSLKPLDLTEMYIAFLDAFSDYPVSFKLTKEQFVRKFVEKLKIDFSLSIGAYDYDALTGFIFTSVNHYEGKLTAYNGGTGVRPNYRGNKLTIQMYDYLKPLLRERKIKQCVLEVLTENTRAIKAYEQVGFESTKYFKCFKLSQTPTKSRDSNFTLNIFSKSYPDWHTYEKFSEYNPSFLDSQQMILSNLANEEIIEAHHENQCVGYAIFQPSFGRISQIGVHPDFRNKGIGSAIIAYIYDRSLQKNLTVININKEAKNTIAFFSHIGFENQLNQYEMVLTL